MHDRLDRLVRQGEMLAPHGGASAITGPNLELQNEYRVWRSQCVEVLRELGSDADHLLREVESDTRGEQFYRASASRVLGVLKAARLLTG